jgi:hypothetical protein
MTSVVKIQTIGGVLSEKMELLHQLVNGEIPPAGSKNENFKTSTKTLKYPEQQYEVTFLEPIRNYFVKLKNQDFHEKLEKHSLLETSNLVLYVFNVYYGKLSEIAENVNYSKILKKRFLS